MRNADENIMFYGDASRYDKRTGNLQYCPYFKCEDYKKKRWYEIGGSPHDEYFLYEVWIEKEFGIWEREK